MFDIVIPVGPNDYDIISKQIEYTKKNIIGYRNIYLICKDYNISIDGCIIISENIFPFDFSKVEEILDKNSDNGRLRVGWYLQQLLKLYCSFYVEGILENYLIIDTDTFFLKPTTFINENGLPLYCTGSEHHIPYFVHMNRLDKSFVKMKSESGICHHMFFQKKYIQEIFDIIEKNYNKPFWVVFLELVEKNQQSGASEYELYFNYMLKYHPDSIIIRQLRWKNSSKLINDNDYDYISVHHYQRDASLL
jgi:hypothetical protein